MRAWLIDNEDESRCLVLKDIKMAKPGPEEVLIDVRAIGVNRADIMQRKGLYPPPAGLDERRPGLEYAGKVAAAGKAVKTRQVGDPVMGLIGGGAYAEQIIVHESETIRPPAHHDFVTAAALPEAFLTAYRGLFLEGQLAPGEWALIRGATSAVGIAALQLINALGSRSIATSRSQERLDALRSLLQSLDLGGTFDYGVVDGEQGVAEQVKQHTDGAHLVLDFIGAAALQDNFASLRDEGRQVQIGLLGGTKAEVNIGSFLKRRLSWHAMTMRSLPMARRIAMAEIFEQQLRPLFEKGRLRSFVDYTFDFEQANEAHELMQSGSQLGKIVLVRNK